jgi:hypothetical protein
MVAHEEGPEIVNSNAKMSTRQFHRGQLPFAQPSSDGGPAHHAVAGDAVYGDEGLSGQFPSVLRNWFSYHLFAFPFNQNQLYRLPNR